MWTDSELSVSAVYGSQAMFAYDDGTGVDHPVRNEAEWNQFMDLLRSDKVTNAEYDILLLAAGSWSKYELQQKAVQAGKV
jgi:hypothetical protein